LYFHDKKRETENLERDRQREREKEREREMWGGREKESKRFVNLLTMFV